MWPEHVVLGVLDGGPTESWEFLDGSSAGACNESQTDFLRRGEEDILRIILSFQRRQPVAIDSATGWPGSLQQEWLAFMQLVAAHLELTTDSGVANLHRIRITLEAERQRDELRHGPAPLELHDQIAAKLTRVRGAIELRKALRERHQPIVESTVLVFAWPLDNPTISSFYGYRADPFAPGEVRFHAGIDLAAPYGRLVRASAAGLVLHAGWAGGHGKSVTIEHPDGYRSVYSHLATIMTDVGLVVEQHAPIGLVGDTGRATGPHLHFEIRRRGRAIDPLELLEVPLAIKYVSQEGSQP